MPIKDVIDKISRGTTEIINVDSLKEKLAESVRSGEPLRIKVGFDPTAPDIHLGHVVLLRKLKQFQDIGHRIFFLIGDFTAQVGDPTDRDQLRPRMDQETILQNASTYKKQVFKILDESKTEVVFNSKWLAALSAQKIIELTAFSSVAQMLARSDFKKRFDNQQEISILEFVYPLLQGYDSVHLEADVELGGTDQKFNLLMARQLQESFGQAPQVVVMTPLLEGTDGVKKMSKSLGNYIGIDEPPNEIFGKIMSISDELMLRYYEILTDVDLDEVKAGHPKEMKMRLGELIVAQFYDDGVAGQARQEFAKVFSQKETPDDIATYQLGTQENENLAVILLANKIVASKRELRRLLQQGAISHNDERISAEDWRLKSGIIKVGKRRFIKLIQ
ncbi:MAG: tyrosine--tRNA ligase [Candidatus Omnitrophica bacterium]|nr:tyrosine--tRNA ligase [Candidatus Omnitrophota bacterium]